MGEYIFAMGGAEYKVDVKKIEGNIATVVIDGKEVKLEIKKFGMQDSPPVQRAEKKRTQAVVMQAVQPIPSVVISSATSGGGKGAPVKAPIPGVVLKIIVKEGDRVKAGQDVLIMEAMKMENQIQTPVGGVVSRINVKVDSAVQQDEILMEIDPS